MAHTCMGQLCEKNGYFKTFPVVLGAIMGFLRDKKERMFWIEISHGIFTHTSYIFTKVVS